MEEEQRLQQAINEITPETIKDIQAIILKETVPIEQVISLILISSHIRPTKVVLLSNLCIELSKRNEKFKNILYKCFKKQVFSDPLKRGKEIVNIQLYHQLYDSGLITRDFILQQLEIVIERFSNHIEVLGSFFLWFYYDFEDHQLFNRYEDEFVKTVETRENDEFLSNYGVKVKHEIFTFNAYVPMRDFAFNPFSWAYINETLDLYVDDDFFLKDDVDTLQQIVSSTKDFDFNQRVVDAKSHPFLQFYPTILQVAAFYGAIKCFKFLILNGSSLEEPDYEMIMKNRKAKTMKLRWEMYVPRFLNTSYAVAGGNIEIIRIMEQKNLHFDEIEANIALYFHHNDVYQWLVDTKNILKTTQNMYLAAITNNLHYFMNCYNDLVLEELDYENYKEERDADDTEEEDGDNCYGYISFDHRVTARHVVIKNGYINLAKFLEISPEEIVYSYHQESLDASHNKKEIGKSALSIALKYNRGEIIKYFLPNAKDKSHIYHWAVWRNELEIVKSLINEYHVDINTNIKGFTAIDVAKYRGFNEMVTFLSEHGCHCNQLSDDFKPVGFNPKTIFYEIIDKNNRQWRRKTPFKTALDIKASKFIKKIKKMAKANIISFQGRKVEKYHKLNHYNIRGGTVLAVLGAFVEYC